MTKGWRKFFIIVVAVIALIVDINEIRKLVRSYQRPPIDLSKFKIKFSVDFNPEVNKLPDLTYIQMKPKERGLDLLRQRSGLYEEHIDLPDRGKEYLAIFNRAAHDVVFSRNPSTRHTWVCFIREEEDPIGEPTYALLNCKERDWCRVNALDPGWADDCQKPAQRQAREWSWPFRFVSLAAAETGSPRIGEEPGWVVPSLKTLRRKKDRDRTGYTEFIFETDPLQGIKANYFTHSIRVNGVSAFIDGWNPEFLRERIEPSKGVSFSFGLQNGVFSGANKGYELIENIIEFRHLNDVIKRVPVPIPYAALRDYEYTIERKGIKFRGKAIYHTADKNKFEIFIFSSKEVHEAKNLQQKIAASRLRFDGQEVVGVIRPRLPPNEYYGVVIGLTQQTGPIHFTFDEQTAKRLCKWALRARTDSSVKHLIDPNVYRYELEHRAPGTSRFRLCKDLQ